MIAKILAALKNNPEILKSLVSDDDEGFDIEGAQSQWDDANNIISGHESKIAEMSAANEEAMKTIADLKSKNYDLLMSVGDNKPDNEDDDNDSADDNVSIDDLFTEKEK